MARSPIAAAMVGKTIGRTIDEHEIPVYVERFGSTKDEIFVTAPELRKELGDDEFERLPTGAIGLYTYYERLAQGLRQLMCGARKFDLSHISRDDLAALTREAADVSGITLPQGRGPDGGGGDPERVGQCGGTTLVETVPTHPNDSGDDGRQTMVDRDSTSAHPKAAFTQIGKGEIGGKAQGLVRVDTILRERLAEEAHPEFTVDIPWFWVIATDWFDRFMEQNRLYDIALSDTRDPHMANAFQKADLPAELADELKNLIAEVHVPLAVRSSSLLEDALQEPFAGVYATKMVPNNQFSAEARLRTLVEAIKFVYASTFTRDAKSYRQAMGRSHRDEKMAVIIQEVVGLRHGDRFYPNVSGVARSYNFYALGHARPENGVVSLALGLGKTIVDGGRSWTYCPAHPKAKPPFGSTKELLNQTQTRFWSVNMGKPPTYDPIRETEYLFEGNLGHAEEDARTRGEWLRPTIPNPTGSPWAPVRPGPGC